MRAYFRSTWLPMPNKSRHETTIIVLSLAVVIGMAIAVAVVLLWTKFPAILAGGAGMRAAVALCPPFMLVQVVGGTDDTTMGLIITTGTILIANASLYAGLAMFVLWALTAFRPAKPRQ